MSIAASTTPPIEYPSGDGQPMAETWLHVRAIMWLHQALEDFFGPRSDVFIASDMYWYWQEGRADLKIAPDVMAIPGVGVRPRRSFFSWEENGAVPAIVFEMASEGTWQDDLDDKYDRYEELGVKEYFLFDPEGLYLVPRVQGYRLHGSAYRRIRQNQLTSALGFGLRAEDTMLRLIDLKTGQPIPTRAEAAETAQRQAEAAQRQAEAEKQRADALQEEVERLRARLQQLDHTNGSEG
ncbi:Uma2 family endonuclease [Gemmata sp. G18]|uniref:Uma2 family endonuclease n=1 Tax=Gemmata palustris TaxID=2822762 RepID=A0ABS5BJ17_9BACT|nr:Uma2 family endonuclease [Gemmata palustris]MBP3953691.1 Uma2 family endonuclease [Gemmata palustris]